MTTTMPETDPWVDFNIGSDVANSAEEGKDEIDGKTGKESNSEESNEGSEKESTDATSSAVDEKEEEEKEEDEREEKEEEKTTMRPNTKARWSGKSSSSERLATPLLAILLTSLTLISRF